MGTGLLRQRKLPAWSLSRVRPYDWFGALAFYPIGLVFWGGAVELLGITDALWLAAGLRVTATLGLLAVPDIRRLPMAPGPLPSRP